MRLGISNRIVVAALLLALSIVPGPGGAATLARTVVQEPSMDMSGAMAPGGCHGCPDGGMNADICGLMCLGVPVIATAPGVEIAAVFSFQAIDWQIGQSSLTGLSPPPDPGPPRPV